MQKEKNLGQQNESTLNAKSAWKTMFKQMYYILLKLVNISSLSLEKVMKCLFYGHKTSDNGISELQSD